MKETGENTFKKTHEKVNSVGNIAKTIVGKVEQNGKVIIGRTGKIGKDIGHKAKDLSENVKKLIGFF